MTEDNLNKGWVVLKGKFAGKLIHDEPTIDLLTLLMKQQLSLTQMSERLGLGKSTVHYQLKKLLDNNIVSCIKEEKRQGRAIKYYAATSEKFFVPFVESNSNDIYEFFAKNELPHFELFLKNSLKTQANYNANWGYAIFKAGKGVATGVLPEMSDSLDTIVEDALKAEVPALWSSWSSLVLNTQQAKQLQLELTTLFEHYNALSQTQDEADSTMSRYLVRLGITPTKDD